tara:strand:+ start:735 stop:1478 length:744 start_codon:yes stop_codon:yes gene_type:complete
MKKKKLILGLIPCRLNSKRLPRKALLNIDGLPLIVHTFKRAQLSKKLDRIIVCTDSEEIKKIVVEHGGEAILTKKSHKNGTDRIAEVAKKIICDVIIDIQGDFPMLDPKNIDKLVDFHKNNNFDIIVPSSPLFDGSSKDVVKLIVNKSNKVLYFSRAPVPYSYNLKPKFYLKHMSIISFNRSSLIKYSNLKQSYYEKIEGVELLRAIENNINVGSFEISKDIFSVDIKKDYLKALSLMPLDPIRKKY